MISFLFCIDKKITSCSSIINCLLILNDHTVVLVLYDRPKDNLTPTIFYIFDRISGNLYLCSTNNAILIFPTEDYITEFY